MASGHGSKRIPAEDQLLPHRLDDFPLLRAPGNSVRSLAGHQTSAKDGSYLLAGLPSP